MLKKLQIALLFLGMSVILLHDFIPHHHHEAFSEPDCVNQILHSEIKHHCDFSSHEHESSGDLVCHFYIIANKFSFAKYFVAAPQIHLPELPVQTCETAIEYSPPIQDLLSFLPCFLRAPPVFF